MPEVCQDGRIGFLRRGQDRLGGRQHRLRLSTHLVQSVGERIVSTRSSSKNIPIVYDKLVTTWSGLAFRNFL